MAVTKTVPGGITIEDFWEQEAGGTHSKALLLAELGSSVYGALEEWRYDREDHEETSELVRLLTPLHDFLERISITSDGDLTLDRRCRRCGGDGQTPGEDPCVECCGRGSTRLVEGTDG